MSRSSLLTSFALFACGTAFAGTVLAQTPVPTAGVVAPAAPSAPGAAPAPAPSCAPDAEGYCQKAEFIGWNSDGTEAAFFESFAKEPPVDQAYDTLFLKTREGTTKRWLIGAEAAVTEKVDTLGKVLYGGAFRKASPKSPDGSLTAKVQVKDGTAEVSFKAAKGKPEQSAVTFPVELPYKNWAFEKQPSAGDFFWAPDGGAFALTVKAVRKEPAGGKLPVSAVFLYQLRPAAPMAAPGAAPAAAPTAAMPR